MKIAVIDLGSNSARMSIAKDADTAVSYRRYVRLSQDMGPEKTLKPQPCQRAVAALKEFQSILTCEGCDQVIAVATEAVRKAANQADFLAMAQREAGICLRVLSGAEESYYDYLAARHLLQNESGVLLDVGGGSFELIVAEGGGIQNDVCLPYGAVALMEAEKSEDAALEKARAVMAGIGGLPAKANIVGLGGAIRCLANICGAADTEGFVISTDVLEQQITRIKNTPLDERSAIAGLETDRQDIIIGGLAPFSALAKAVQADRITVTSRGVREGILVEYYDRL